MVLNTVESTRRDTTKIPTKIEDISFLTFIFPEGEDFYRVRLPFFQNPSIKEGGKANFVEYNPLSRAGSLFSYTGTKSRTFNISFELTLPLILELGANSLAAGSNPKLSIGAQKEQFFDAKGSSRTGLGFAAAHGNASEFYRQHLEDPARAEERASELGLSTVYKDITGRRSIVPNTDDAALIKEFVDGYFKSGQEDSGSIRGAIDIVMYWVNIVRSSVINNAENPSFGPPIVRINQGIMYQDVPCICTGYKINYGGNSFRAGFDQRTMLPRVIQISMNLVEHRAGNFGKFDINDVIARDNVVGWESVIKGSHTLDPINRRFVNADIN